MKKILHVIAQQPGKTGSGIFAKNILHQADKKGYSQTLIAGVPFYQDKKVYCLPEGICFEPVIFESGQLPFPVVGMSDEMPYESTRYDELTGVKFELWEENFSRSLKEAVESFEPDLVLTHHLWLLTALTREKFPELPVFAFSHGSDLRQMEKNRNHSLRVINSCKKLDGIFALNDFQKTRICEFYDVPPEMVEITGAGYDRNCFNEDNFETARKPGQIVYAGKISKAKGVKSLLDAFEIVSSRRPETILFIAGSGKGMEYESLAGRAKKMKSVRLMGNMDQCDLAKLFGQSDVFALPSFYEGLPLVLVEAAACGMKLVVSELGGLKEWFGEDMMVSQNSITVPLPRMVSVDKPHKEDENDYALRFADALVAQIDRASGTGDSAIRKEFVKRKSWESVFDAIEKHIDSKMA
ncbi:MAG TPA: glycosyltransferase family 4 protein [Clostridia bacterium]|nr:glycosyltransferase family 4 protein [Clostridia bacterium]